MTGHFDSQDESRTIDWRSSGTVAEVEGTRQQLQKVRLHVSTLGCQIKPGSRIAVFEQHFSRFMEPGYNPRRDSDFSPVLLAHGVRDVFELQFICEEFAKGHRDELRSALPDLLSGATIPSDDRNQKARNLQFQYFLTAQLLHSGFTVSLDEPDAIFVHGSAPIGVAAKRPVSANQLVRRVKEGVKQLAKQQLTGFIALSLDRLLKITDPYLVAIGESALDMAAQEHVRKVLAPYARRVQKAIAETNITGIIVSLTLVGCVRVPWQPAHTTATLWLPRQDDLPREGELVKSVVEALKGPSVT